MKPKEQRKHYDHGLKGVVSRGNTLFWASQNCVYTVYMDGLHVHVRENQPSPTYSSVSVTIYDKTFQRYKHATEMFYDMCRLALLDAVPHEITPMPRKTRPTRII